MKIRTKLAIVLLIVTLVLGGVVYAGLELFKQQEVTQTRAEVNETASLTAKQVNEVVKERVNTAKFYASRPQTANFSQSAASLNLFVDSSRFYAVQLIAANGTVVDYRGDVTIQSRRQTVGTNVSSRPYFRSVLRSGGNAYISDIETAESIDRKLLIVSVPVFDPETNEIKGVLAGGIRVRQGDFFTSAEPLETSTQAVSINATENGSVVALQERHRRFNASIAESATVPETGWTVTVSRDRRPLQQDLQGLAIAQGVGLLFVLGIVGGLGWYEYVTNLRATDTLLDGFERLQEGDYEHTISLESAEEWQQISDGYNEMSMGIKERERAIREREQRLGVLNRVLRHNLQNDMSVIMSYAEMLPDFADEPRVEDAADKILEMGRGLISHGKKARQIETAMESAEEGRTRVEIVPLVEDIVAEYRNAHEGVVFETDLPESAPAQVISSFEFAIENLVENAAEHNDADDPLVAVTVEHTGETVIVHVADNGPGVPSHEYDVLEQEQETALEHGSGVGLWLAHWVVEKSEGELAFDDNEPRGAVVSIEVECADPPQTDAADPDAAEAHDDAPGEVETDDTSSEPAVATGEAVATGAQAGASDPGGKGSADDSGGGIVDDIVGGNGSDGVESESTGATTDAGPGDPASGGEETGESDGEDADGETTGTASAILDDIAGDDDEPGAGEDQDPAGGSGEEHTSTETDGLHTTAETAGNATAPTDDGSDEAQDTDEEMTGTASEILDEIGGGEPSGGDESTPEDQNEGSESDGPNQ